MKYIYDSEMMEIEAASTVSINKAPEEITVKNKITIAIDGYSSCGKSTLAKALSSRLGYAYVDSGAMYRAVTLYCLQNNIISPGQPVDVDAVINHLPKIQITFQYNPEHRATETYLNNVNVESEIRQMIVSENVSEISKIREVRQLLITKQREFGKFKGVVMDGRDIGTAVFPTAELKLFMTADPEVRVQRRYDELHAKGLKVSRDEVKKNLETRDHEDTHRKENPLVKADDAIMFDNSDLDEKQQLDFILKMIVDYGIIHEEN